MKTTALFVRVVLDLHPLQLYNDVASNYLGAITTLAFMAFGCIPLISFLLPFKRMPVAIFFTVSIFCIIFFVFCFFFAALVQIIVSVSLALFSFFALGAIKVKLFYSWRVCWVSQAFWIIRANIWTLDNPGGTADL